MRQIPGIVAATLVSAPACAPADAPQQQVSRSADAVLEDAFRHRRSDLHVHGEGVVLRLLSDDNHGSRHQRFLLELSSGQTLLVAHNLDTAPRIPLAVGDRVGFSGEYEWNPQGGVLHWTHRDDRGGHPHGWLEHGGRRYD